jgi:release factor glutamine methyltransferase
LFVGQLFLEEKSLPLIDLTNIVSHVLKVSKERLIMEPERSLNDEQWGRVQGLMAERRKGKPLAYLTNQREFFSETFYVDERVLIPRPETEVLVEEALALLRARKDHAWVLDMGTGSGIIGVMLAKGGAKRVLCVDKSPDAIAVARTNSRMLGVEGRLTFLVSDLFSAMRGEIGPSFDMICANLPYVSTDEYAGLMDDVRCFEPRDALDGGTGGMDIYERFFREIGSYLRPGGAVLCEIGGVEQSEKIGDLLKRSGFAVTVKNDLAGRQRMVRGLWTSSS